MRGRLWLIVLIAIVCGVLGLLIAGIPGKRRDRPLSVRVAAVSAPRTTGAPATTMPPTTTVPSTTQVPQARAPADVHVRVANASTAGMAATHMATRLGDMGYQVLAPLNADRSDLTATVVVFNPGFELEARALAQSLGASLVVAGDPTLNCAGQVCAGDLVVFVGRDLST
jgi:hypothetical protein